MASLRYAIPGQTRRTSSPVFPGELIPGELVKGGRDHDAGMAAEHLPGAHVAGVTSFPGDRVGPVAQAIVVIGDRHDFRAPAPPNLAGPGACQRLDGPVDEDLDGVRALPGVGEIADAESGLQLRRTQVRN